MRAIDVGSEKMLQVRISEITLFIHQARHAAAKADQREFSNVLALDTMITAACNEAV